MKLLGMDFLDISNLNFLDFESGYLENFNFLLKITLFALGLTPKADSLAESFIIFFSFLIEDFPGL